MLVTMIHNISIYVCVCVCEREREREREREMYTKRGSMSKTATRY